MQNIITILTIAAIILLFILLGPFVTIWSINTLLEQAGITTQIPHNFWTYLSSLLLILIFNSNGQSK